MEYEGLDENIVDDLTGVLADALAENATYDDLMSVGLEEFMASAEADSVTMNSPDEEFEEFAELFSKYSARAGYPQSEEEWEAMKQEWKDDFRSDGEDYEPVASFDDFDDDNIVTGGGYVDEE